MRKKLDTRFPAARIKKIMQADEDVGKIANAVPVLDSKALELFLQDLCDRTYHITVQRGAKTVNSFHLKHCMHSYNVFDFLREVVSKVPDYGNSDAAVDTPKRRKVVANESIDSDENSKKSSMQQETLHANSSIGRGRERGRGRGRGRTSRMTEREPPLPPPQHDEIEPSPSACEQSVKQVSSLMDNNSQASNQNPVIAIAGVTSGESSDKMFSCVAGTASAGPGPTDVKDEEYPEMDRMAIDPLHLVQISSRLDEEEEEDGYDEG